MTIRELYSIFEECTGVSTDSRSVARGAMFFALHGASFDGNLFAGKALAAGAKYAVVDSDVAFEGDVDTSRLLRVEDTLAALQQLAAEHRRRLAIPIIAVVGSNGKTTTKELVSRVLAERFEVYATRGNLNNHIGVPLTLLAMTRDTEFGVVEMGASACGEIAALCEIASPGYGVITNIGRSHLEGFGGLEGIRRGKGELFDYLERNGGRAFVPTEDEVLVDMAHERQNMAVEYYSRAVADGVESHLSGDYNHSNIAVAVAVGSYFDIPRERICDAVMSYIPDNNRSQEIRTDRNLLIVDCYNANPSSMAVSIANLGSKEGKRKVLILGDMLELGEWSAEEHCRILSLAMALPSAELLLVGGEFKKAAATVGANALCFDSTAALREYLSASPISDATILLKGSHRWGLERVTDLL